MMWYFPSVCCKYILLSLVNKKAASAYVGEEYSQMEKIYRESR